MAASTRSSTEDPLFGQYLDKLPVHQLPIEIEVVRHYLHLREIENEFDSSYMRSGKLIKVVKPENIEIDSKYNHPFAPCRSLKGHTTDFFYYTPGKLFGSRIRN